MFGYDSQPSRIISFDVIQTKNINIVPLKDCCDFLWMCNKYRNKLIELKRQHIDRIAAERESRYPGYGQLLKDIEAISTEITKVTGEIKSDNAATKQRNTGTPEQKNILKQLSAKRKALNEQRKAVKEKIDNTAVFKAFMEKSSNIFKTERKMENANLSSKLFWGFRLGVDRTLPSGYPKFRGHDGSGRLFFQFQAPKGSEPLTWDRLLSGEDNRISIRVEKRVVPLFAGKSKKKNGEGSKKVGEKVKEYMVARLAAGDGRPVIEVPFHMPANRAEQPIPEGCTVKEAYLICERVGTRYRWKLQLVVSRADGFDKPTGEGRCGVDVNWSKMDDGSLFVAAVYGKDADGEHEDSLVLPTRYVDHYRKAELLQGIVDKDFNEAVEKLRNWLAQDEWFNVNLPVWLKDDTKTLHQWKSPRRLYVLMRKWHPNRFAGDEDIFAKMKTWLQRYNHIFNWMANQKKKFVARRDHLYRTFVADMRKKYSKAYIEKLDIAEMKKLPEVTEEMKKATRVNRDVVAPGRLLQIIRETMKYDEVNAAYSSKECHHCHKITNLTDEQEHTCEHCGAAWNRHFNAARVVFGRGESLKGKSKTKAKKLVKPKASKK